MKKITALLSLVIMVAAPAATASTYTITYYGMSGELISTKSIERPSDADIDEYINYYAAEDTETIKVHKLDGGVWRTYKAEYEIAADNSFYTEKAPNVSDEMCYYQYWLDEKDNELILSSSEIKEVNHRILKNEKTVMNDLDNLSDTYNGRKMAEELADFPSPTGMYLNGRQADESYYESIRKNIADAQLGDKEKTRFGICTSRTVLKAYPYGDWLSDSEWDKEWDNFVNSSVQVGEPVVLYNTTADGKFIYAKIACCSGWIPSGDVAICKDKSEWVRAKTHNDFLVVTGERVWLEPSYDPNISLKQLTMGTVLELSPGIDFGDVNRLGWNNYAVKLPVRNPDGGYSEKNVLISANRDVNIGYLPYTNANVVKQAFKSLGNRYGWGGMLDSQDCSSFIREVYLCFGLAIPRNTTWQSAMPVDVKDISAMNDDEKKAALAAAPAGAILIWPEHEMLYLGERNGLYYTINDVSSMVSPADPNGGIVRPRGVIVNDLSTLRGNGTTWLSNLSKIVIVK